MSDKVFENNQVTIAGTVMTPFEFSHDVFGEKFYTAQISVERLSDTYDILPVMISDRLLDVSRDYTGALIQVSGQFRSHNLHGDAGSKLVLSVFAREITFPDTLPSITNIITLEGFLCKPPVYRKTPLGREITDLLVAVNRPYGKTDYIPCICWGRNAAFAEGFNVGDCVKISGRVQSREYKKRTGEDTYEIRTAYEVSVSKLEWIGEAQ